MLVLSMGWLLVRHGPQGAQTVCAACSDQAVKQADVVGNIDTQ